VAALVRADSTEVKASLKTQLVGWVGLATFAAGLFVWGSWAGVLLPAGGLLMLGAARRQVRWVARPWPLTGPLPAWMGPALGFLLAGLLVAGVGMHLG
jgi:hypothetical protein